MTIFCAFLSSGILAQIVKHIYNSPRPKFYFGNTEDQYFIKGIDFAFNNSFPSGHTATAFAVATVLVLNLQNKKLQLPLLFAALLVAFSRIYLGQHFLLDVLVGAFIGVVCGIGCVYFFWKSKKAK
ncbi:MAG: phosphatase PAP2 family protein [Ferruginibacter sp.]